MPYNAQKADRQFKSLSETKTANSDRLIEVICDSLLEKKAEDITILDVHELTTLADMFVICHATSDVQIKAIADNVGERTKKELNEKPWKEEGKSNKRWVILDYVNVVVHIFNLEKMWNDAIITKVTDDK